MKERPILFNTEMVKAILDGRKTQTRRVVKAKPMEGDFISYKGEALEALIRTHSPYGVVGDRLWVRETFAFEVFSDEFPPSILSECCRLWYKAGGEKEQTGGTRLHLNKGRWRPSIHMPRWASRITLEITDIRVERVQDISEEDAKAEGADKLHIDDLGQTWKSHKRGFETLWDSINDKRGYGWNKNPWVWVVEFKRIA